MATKAQKTKVGILLLGGVLLALGAVAASGLLLGETVTHYYMIVEGSVGELTRGANVRYQGIPVGQVTDLEISRRNQIRVDIEIKEDRISIREGVKAELATAGLLGATYVHLSGGDPASPVVPPGSEIPVEVSVLQDLSTRLPRLLEELNSVMTSVDSSLQALSREDLEAFTTNLNATLDESRNQIQRTGNELSETLEAINETVKALERAATGLHLETVSDEIRVTLQALQRLTAELGGAVDQLKGAAGGLTGAVTGVELNLRRTMNEASQTLKSAQSLFEYLERHPDALLRGRQSAGEEQE